MEFGLSPRQQHGLRRLKTGTSRYGAFRPCRRPGEIADRYHSKLARVELVATLA